MKKIQYNLVKTHSKFLNVLLNFGITLILIFIIIFLMRLLGINFTTSTGATFNNFSNKWSAKFHYLNGGVQGQFTAKNHDSQLIYSSNIEKGTIVFQLYNSTDSLLLTFPANSNTDTLKGIFEKGEKYTIRANATKTQGSFEFRME